MQNPLALLFLAVPCLAQIPTDATLVFESTPLVADYYKFVDVLGRGTTTVRGQSVFMPIESVAVDPSAADTFYYLGAASSLAGTWQGQFRLLAEIGTNIWGPWSQTAADRIAVGSNYIATIAGTSLQVFAKVGNLPGQNFVVPASVDIAFFGDLIYLGGDGASGAAPIVELDVITGTTRTVGNYSGTSCIAVSPTGSELCIGTIGGDLVRIDVATGAVTSMTPTGLGDLVAVEYTRFATLVYADAFSLFSELVPGNPIYISSTAILDIGVGTIPVASIVPFGNGCGVAAAANWSAPESPTIGNVGFSLGLLGAPAQSAVLLALGEGRGLWTATGASLPFDLQPFGAPGCQLLVDPQVVQGLPTSAGGAANQPFPIPVTPSLVGLEISAQWFVPDASVGSLGFAATEAVAFVIQ